MDIKSKKGNIFSTFPCEGGVGSVNKTKLGNFCMLGGGGGPQVGGEGCEINQKNF